MSLLFSDSLIGVIDEKVLAQDEPDDLGKIEINGSTYAIDSFVTDRKSIRVHVIAEQKLAIDLLNLRPDLDARVTLGEHSFVASGKIQQIGWERLQDGGRLIIGLILRDK